MNYATNIAIVDKKTNLVVNTIWGMIYQVEEFNTDNLLAVVVNDLAVSIGDTYDGEYFYHDGEKVLTNAEIIADMRAALELLGVSING